MSKKICPNGHVYDPDIYGDQCPMCPAGTPAGHPQAPLQPGGIIGGGEPPTHFGGSPSKNNFDGHTHVAKNPFPGSPGFVPGGTAEVSGATRLRPKDKEPIGRGHTVIRRPGRQQPSNDPGRKLVGFLVTYSHTPMGKAYNLYEGRNYIGRDDSCDICVSEDSQMSGRHMSILYRNVDNKFKFRDEQSSNGTFINKQLLDDGELQNYDIIRAGSTLFIFIAIPKIG